MKKYNQYIKYLAPVAVLSATVATAPAQDAAAIVSGITDQLGDIGGNLWTIGTAVGVIVAIGIGITMLLRHGTKIGKSS